MNSPASTMLVFGCVLWMFCIGGVAIANLLRPQQPWNAHRLFLWLWFLFFVVSGLAVLIRLEGADRVDVFLQAAVGYAVPAVFARHLARKFRDRQQAQVI